jgi:hypothetical protein
MARDADPASSTRRIVTRAALLLVPLVAGAIAAPRLLGHLGAGGAGRAPAESAFRPPTEDEIETSAEADRRLAEAERGWRKSTVIVPEDARPDASGETVRRFQGFGISVESAPEGARVLVNGADKGETPLVASVECTPGDPVRIELQKPPLSPQQRVTTCRADALVELSVKLAR